MTPGEGSKSHLCAEIIHMCGFSKASPRANGTVDTGSQHLPHSASSENAKFSFTPPQGLPSGSPIQHKLGEISEVEKKTGLQARTKFRSWIPTLLVTEPQFSPLYNGDDNST